MEPWTGGKTLFNCHENMCRQNTQQMEWLESSCSKIKSTQTCKVQRNQLITQRSNFQTQVLSLTEWHVSFVKLFMDNPSDEPVDFANQNWDHLRMVEPAQDDLSILSLTCWITYKLNYASKSRKKNKPHHQLAQFFQLCHDLLASTSRLTSTRSSSNLSLEESIQWSSGWDGQTK